jgi:D-alanyl-D-alanine carboxypeptidase
MRYETPEYCNDEIDSVKYLRGDMKMVKGNYKIMLLFFIIMIGFVVATLYHQSKNPTIHSQSAILIDATSGDILLEKDANTGYPVASMSKLMTEYIVLDYIKNGTINWEDHVIISESANNIQAAGIKIPVEVGDSLSVRDLFAAMIVSSANNATVALAEHIAGTEEAFTILMNEKALDIGLSNQSIFVNATGLPESSMENEMSAEDVAILAYHLLNDHQEVLDIASYPEYQIEYSGIQLYSTNKMLSKMNSETYFDGVDGLKTGFTSAAGYCFAGTAQQGDRRLISVVINAEDDDSRFIETKKLFAFGFDKFFIPPFEKTVKTFLKKLVIN